MNAMYRLLKALWHFVPARIRRLDLFQKWSMAVTRSVGSHDDIYTERYYKESVDSDSNLVAPIIGDLVQNLFHANTVIDVGCGTGAILKVLHDRGLATFGLEYSEAALQICKQRGLSVRKFDLEKDECRDLERVDVAISTEVAEHLPESCADRFVDVLTRLSHTIIFTAATPGQGGRDHVNEQPHDYWIQKFAIRGFKFLEAETKEWRGILQSRGAALCYYTNLMLFQKTS